MPKVSQEKKNSRKEEIISACASLYEERSFKEITLVDIGKATSLSRPSIYNYFETKEEIFLALLEKEYDMWNEDLASILEEEGPMSVDSFADKLAKSIEKRARLLKILSMNIYDMEASSRLEKLIDFKRSYAKSLELVTECFRKFFPEKDAEPLVYAFFPFMFGIYPYVYATDKQKKAMEEAGIHRHVFSIYEIAFSGIKNLLS